jgi:type IV pilus assembly protein PilE
MKKQKAFTLIELMVTVAIIGILASIAYPSYRDSVMKSRRADAQGALLAYANSMERYFTVNNTYLTVSSTVVAPTNAGTTYYTIAISTSPAATASTYTINATPIDAQATDICGTLTLTSTGAKGYTGTSGSKALCW